MNKFNEALGSIVAGGIYTVIWLAVTAAYLVAVVVGLLVLLAGAVALFG